MEYGILQIIGLKIKPARFRCSYLIDYLGDTRILKSVIGVTGFSFNFESISVAAKTDI